MSTPGPGLSSQHRWGLREPTQIPEHSSPHLRASRVSSWLEENDSWCTMDRRILQIKNLSH